jgi:thiol-disulfide isomerase/thioredoxin
MRRTGAALVLFAAAALTAGCSADPFAQQYLAGDNKGYIAGDFQTVEIAPENRSAPIVFEGTTETGQAIDSAALAGSVVVVNFWYAACGPCIVEAPRLEQSYQQFAGQDVVFLGVNTYDQSATAAAFARDNGVSYPSLMAVDDSELKLAFAAATPLSATPTTLVLEIQGRVAARIVGELPDASILTTLVRDTLAEAS